MIAAGLVHWPWVLFPLLRGWVCQWLRALWQVLFRPRPLLKLCRPFVGCVHPRRRAVLISLSFAFLQSFVKTYHATNEWSWMKNWKTSSIFSVCTCSSCNRLRAERCTRYHTKNNACYRPARMHKPVSAVPSPSLSLQKAYHSNTSVIAALASTEDVLTVVHARCCSFQYFYSVVSSKISLWSRPETKLACTCSGMLFKFRDSTIGARMWNRGRTKMHYACHYLPDWPSRAITNRSCLFETLGSQGQMCFSFVLEKLLSISRKLMEVCDMLNEKDNH